jgi:hypothetical protein
MTYPAKAAIWIIALWLVAVIAILALADFGPIVLDPFLMREPLLFTLLGIATTAALGVFIVVVNLFPRRHP